MIVDKWFAENTFHAHEFADIAKLVALKERHNLTISVGLPTLNEEKTVGTVIKRVKGALMDRVPLIDQLVVVDSDSEDRTVEIATTRSSARSRSPMTGNQPCCRGTWRAAASSSSSS